MNVIAENLYKLSNISKNIKSKLNSFSQQQIEIIENIINACYAHAVKNNVVLNTKLFQLFNKLNAKNAIIITNGKLVFPQINIVANIDYYAKIYTSYIDKIIPYLRKNIKNEQQYQDLFDLINDEQISDFTNTKTIFAETNDLNTAQQIETLVQKSAVNNIILSAINRIDFAEGEEKTMQAIRAKMATGNKHEQIQNSDVSSLVDVDDAKQILKNNENDNINKTNQSSALN